MCEDHNSKIFLLLKWNWCIFVQIKISTAVQGRKVLAVICERLLPLLHINLAEFNINSSLQLYLDFFPMIWFYLCISFISFLCKTVVNVEEAMTSCSWALNLDEHHPFPSCCTQDSTDVSLGVASLPRSGAFVWRTPWLTPTLHGSLTHW